MTVEDQIRTFIVDELQWRGSADELRDDMSLIDGGVIDSLGIMKTIGFVERQFRIKVRDEDVLPSNFETIEAIAAFVRRKSAS